MTGRGSVITKALRNTLSPTRVGAIVDANITLSDAGTHVCNVPLTANRTVTLPDGSEGNSVRVVRTAASTGAFKLNVGTGPLFGLDPAEWADFEFNGTAWVLTGAGSLA